MSSFKGFIEDIPGISIDNFTGQNMKSNLFLLSHCHSDHMHGLDKDFFEHLNANNQYLYCSPISKIILENKRKEDICNLNVIKTLEIHSPQTLYYTFNQEKMSVTITCISSGHCPGSVMFILENNDLTILYTGDFRYNIDDLNKLNVFHCFDKVTKKRFSKIYFDSTFLSEIYPKFPSRQESVAEIINISKLWLDADTKNIVTFECSANHGQEYIYKKLATFFKTKIHVKSNNYNTFVQIGMSEYITNDGNVRIHDCNYKVSKNSRLQCNYSIPIKNVLIIVPSALIWKNWNNQSISVNNLNRPNVKNVCYSMHSSFEELKAFIKYAQCTEFIPFVCPNGSSISDVYKLIENIKTNTDGIHINSLYNIDSNNTVKKPRLENTFKSAYISSDED